MIEGRPAADPQLHGRAAENEVLAGLLRRSAAGDQNAFADLYDRTSSRIYGIVLRVLRSADLAVEVTQEVYVEVWRQATRYQLERGAVMSWMATMAHRRAVDQVRSVSRQRVRDRRWALLEAIPEQDYAWTGAEEKLEVEEVRRELSNLTGIQREAIMLAYFDGYNQSQLADLLDVPLGTVKSRIRDGLIRLRTALVINDE